MSKLSESKIILSTKSINDKSQTALIIKVIQDLFTREFEIMEHRDFAAKKH